ncbi:MAG: glycosyltransferase family 2 protein, partial [Candidatus Micrarchaeaceae archaeon]
IMLLAIYEGFIAIVFAAVLALDINGFFQHAEKYKTVKGFKPKTLIILPAKGQDVTQLENFSSLKNQSYHNYDIVAVVDSSSDPASIAASKVGIKTVIAKGTCERCSGKNRAIAYALKTFQNYNVYVIADSDIRVSNTWLEKLIKPLSDARIGISTTFPFFVPIDNSIWSKIKMLWGLVGQSLMGSKITRFGWGGSLAFKKNLVDKRLFYLLEDSKYAISDDISITKRAKEKGLGIAYVKDAEVVVNVKENAASFTEWANRQAALTLLGYRKNLYIGTAYYSAELLLLASGIAMSIFVAPIFAILLLHLVISEYKSIARMPKRSLALLFIVLAMPAIYLYNLVKASRMESIEWRGRIYSISK